MSKKSPEAFRTISEVAEWLGVPTHVLRFWESRFTQVKPVKRAGGRRYYRPADMQLLGGIRKLLHDDGMTIRGVQKLLREEGVKYVSALSPSLDEPVLPKATKDNVIDLDKARESEREEAEEEAPAAAGKTLEEGEAASASANEGTGAALDIAAGEKGEEVAAGDATAEAGSAEPESSEATPAMETSGAQQAGEKTGEQEDELYGTLFESPEQLDFMSHDAEVVPDPETPGVSEPAPEAPATGSAAGAETVAAAAPSEEAPEEAAPSLPAFDLSHIREDPALDAPADTGAPTLSQRLRHLRRSGKTGQVNPAALKAIQIRLISLRERFEVRGSRH